MQVDINKIKSVTRERDELVLTTVHDDIITMRRKLDGWRVILVIETDGRQWHYNDVTEEDMKMWRELESLHFRKEDELIQMLRNRVNATCRQVFKV